MTYREHFAISGIDCSARNCNAEITLPGGATTELFAGRRTLDGMAEARGWSAWVGRGRRLYCPLHGPRKGTRMWLHFGNDVNGAASGEKR